jgi:NAD(P)-dependent dehydrogenase (short-subunit alcohol dehydrogenase family)
VLPGTPGETLKQIEALGRRALAIPTDLSKEADLKRVVDLTVERFGGVDILVNNAAATTGTAWSKQFLNLTREEWLYQFDVNVHAPFTLMQLVVPIMEKRGGGRIINVTTGCGEVFRLPEEPVPLQDFAKLNLNVPGYFASKRALDRLGSVVAPELAIKNIYVIGLMPGWVATELVAIRMEQQNVMEGAEEGVRAQQKAQADMGVRPVPMTVPSRMIVYFSACENPREYTGRLFFAEREMADMGITAD